MPRNMSFMLTTKQIKNRTKTVTRRIGWDFLRPGDIVNAVEKGMGLKKGEKIKYLCQIRIKSIRKESLFDITQADCVREGFPEMTPDEFVRFFCEHIGHVYIGKINRIEFEYL